MTILITKTLENTFGKRSEAVKSSQGMYQDIFLVNLSWIFFRYGHGVLRNPDPRFIALQEFCKTRPELQASSMIQLVQKV